MMGCDAEFTDGSWSWLAKSRTGGGLLDLFDLGLFLAQNMAYLGMARRQEWRNRSLRGYLALIVSLGVWINAMMRRWDYLGQYRLWVHP